MFERPVQAAQGGGIGEAPRPMKKLVSKLDDSGARRRAFSLADSPRKPSIGKGRFAAPLWSGDSARGKNRSVTSAALKNSTSDSGLGTAASFRPLHSNPTGGIGEAPHAPMGRRDHPPPGASSSSHATSQSMSSLYSASHAKGAPARGLAEREAHKRQSTGATDTTASSVGHWRNISSSTAPTSDSGSPGAGGGPKSAPVLTRPEGSTGTSRQPQHAAAERSPPDGSARSAGRVPGGNAGRTAHGGSFVASLGMAPISSQQPPSQSIPAFQQEPASSSAFRVNPRQPTSWAELFDPSYRPTVPLASTAVRPQVAEPTERSYFPHRSGVGLRDRRPTVAGRHSGQPTLAAGVSESHALRSSASAPALSHAAAGQGPSSRRPSQLRRPAVPVQPDETAGFEPLGGLLGTYARPRPRLRPVPMPIAAEPPSVVGKRRMAPTDEAENDAELLHIRSNVDHEQAAKARLARPYSAERVMTENLRSQAEREKWENDGLRMAVTPQARRRAASVRERQRRRSSVSSQTGGGRPRGRRRGTSDSFVSAAILNGAQGRTTAPALQANKLRKRKDSDAGVAAAKRSDATEEAGCLPRRTDSLGRPLTPTFLTPRKAPPRPPTNAPLSPPVSFSFDALLPASMRRRPSLPAKKSPFSHGSLTRRKGAAGRQSPPNAGTKTLHRHSKSLPDIRSVAIASHAPVLPSLPSGIDNSITITSPKEPQSATDPHPAQHVTALASRTPVVSDLERSIVALPPSQRHKFRRELQNHSADPQAGLPRRPSLLDIGRSSKEGFGFAVPNPATGEPAGLRPAPRKQRSAGSWTLKGNERAASSSPQAPPIDASSPASSSSTSSPSLSLSVPARSMGTRSGSGGPMDSPTLGRSGRSSYFVPASVGTSPQVEERLSPKAAALPLAIREPAAEPAEGSERASPESAITPTQPSGPFTHDDLAVTPFTESGDGQASTGPSSSGESTVDLDQYITPDTLFYSPPAVRPRESFLTSSLLPSPLAEAERESRPLESSSDAGSDVTNTPSGPGSRPIFRRVSSRTELVDEILNGYMRSPGAFGTPLSTMALASATSVNAESYFTARENEVASPSLPDPAASTDRSRYSRASSNLEDLETLSTTSQTYAMPGGLDITSDKRNSSARTNDVSSLVDAYENRRQAKAAARPPLLRLPRTGVRNADSFLDLGQPGEDDGPSGQRTPTSHLSPWSPPAQGPSTSPDSGSPGLLSPISSAFGASLSPTESDRTSIRSDGSGSAQSLTTEIQRFPAPPNNTPAGLIPRRDPFAANSVS